MKRSYFSGDILLIPLEFILCRITHLLDLPMAALKASPFYQVAPYAMLDKQSAREVVIVRSTKGTPSKDWRHQKPIVESFAQGMQGHIDQCSTLKIPPRLRICLLHTRHFSSPTGVAYPYPNPEPRKGHGIFQRAQYLGAQ